MSSRVDVHHHDRACERKACKCVPPPDKVEPSPDAEYRCRPVPAAQIPPIGENYLMHIFASPECISPQQTWIYDQFPKRTCGQLMGRPDEPTFGWGVHFQEGWNWDKIWLVVFVLFVFGSLLFGI